MQQVLLTIFCLMGLDYFFLQMKRMDNSIGNPRIRAGDMMKIVHYDAQHAECGNSSVSLFPSVSSPLALLTLLFL